MCSLNAVMHRVTASSRLLRDISVLTRMDEAANMIDMEKMDISVLVTNIVNEVSLELEEKHITVVNSLKKEIQIRGNYSLLYSIFRNLDGQCHRLRRKQYPNPHQLFPRRREVLLLQLCRHRRRSVARTPEPSFRALLPSGQRALSQTGRHGVRTGHCQECRYPPRRKHIGQKQPWGGGLEFVFTLAKER